MALEAASSPATATGAARDGIDMTHSPLAKLAFACVLLLSLACPWWSAWDHPLHAPDEGRYGTVSAAMAASGEWLVPWFRGQPHLTKPPLIYWLEAGAIEVIGRSEFALRIPSLLAGSLTVLVVFLFVRRLRGTPTAVIAAALYGVMPLPLFFERVATTDAVLNACWTTALAAAALAIDARRRGERPALAWLVLAWAAVAVAALDKGPVAPAPMLLAGAWLVLARRWRDLRWFVTHGLWCAALAVAPIALWVGAVARLHPEAWDVWRAQFVERFTTGLPAQPLTAGAAATAADAASAEPFWFYAPVFLAGMFPATCALVLPGFNLRLRESLRAFALGDLRALMLVSVVAPLLFFSLAKGKMPAYVIPAAAPLAVLVAGTLARLAGYARRAPGADAASVVGAPPRGESRAGSRAEAEARTDAFRLPDAPIAIDRDPDVRLTFAVVAGVAFAAATVAGFVLGGIPGVWRALEFLFLPVLAALGVRVWRGGRRRIYLFMMWFALFLSITRLAALEDWALESRDLGARAMVERVRAITKSDRPQFVIYTFRNPTIDFYADDDPIMVWSVGDLRAVWPKLRPDHAILIPRPTWEWIVREYPRLAEVLVPLEGAGKRTEDSPGEFAVWNRWPGKPTVILRMTGQAPDDIPDEVRPRSPEPDD